MTTCTRECGVVSAKLHADGKGSDYTADSLGGLYLSRVTPGGNTTTESVVGDSSN